MNIIGTKFYGHDSAICLIDFSKKEIFAISTERLTRIKHDDTFSDVILQRIKLPRADIIAHSFSDFSEVDTCWETKARDLFRIKNIQIKRDFWRPNYYSDMKIILNSEDTYDFQEFGKAKFEEIEIDQNKFSILLNKTTKYYANHQYVKKEIHERTKIADVEFFDHHLCHAVAAYYPSPNQGEKTLIVTLDGQGDGYFSKIFIFQGDSRELIGGSRVEYTPSKVPSSIGILYVYFTEALGFRPNSDEGKVEALAAFGTPVKEIFDDLTSATFIANNTISFNLEMINPYYDLKWLRSKILPYRPQDVAATIQTYLEETVVNYINSIDIGSPIDRIALAGGVAANIIMNLRIFEKTKYKNIHICPYMGDEGTAVGAAILGGLRRGWDVTWLKSKNIPYWGTEYSQAEVFQAINKRKSEVNFEYIPDSWEQDAANSIANKKIVGVFKSRMEFGPRALGNRSILANPADPNIRQKINVSIKSRPDWQPFCPSVLSSERERLFADSFDHKHMAIAFRVKKEHIMNIPSAVHIDGTARPQFVEEADNQHFFKLLTFLKELTGYGVVINTSFNRHGRTIVENPNDAITDFLDCDLDVLYIEGFKVTRT